MKEVINSKLLETIDLLNRQIEQLKASIGKDILINDTLKDKIIFKYEAEINKLKEEIVTLISKDVSNA